MIATAGHVDHGKSTLVLALTGTDPDRLAEEKARGLTIDLGFASTRLPSGTEIAIVDVPGHVRFLKNMLAGVGAVAGCLFVVAATEGWKAQSEEHLRILELLGLERAVVALTKTDLVDDDHRELARLELADRVAGTFLADAEVVEVDALAGVGLPELGAALDRLVATGVSTSDRGRPRLWIDRAFAPRGAGTVVTGTLTGGRLHVDDELVVLPARHTARVRALQSLHVDHAEVPPDSRVAINLSGIAHDELGRGDVLVRAGDWHETHTVDASLTVLDSLGHTVSRRAAHLAYLGSGEFPVRVRVLGSEAIRPGTEGLVRLHLPVDLPLVPGDRFVLRDAGREETVGGGVILDVAPVRPASKAVPDRSVARVVAERGWVDAAELELLVGERVAANVGGWVVDPDALEAASHALRAAVDAAGPLGLDTAPLDERSRSLLEHLDDVRVQRGRATRPPSGVDRVAVDELAVHDYLRALQASPFRPPPPDGVDRGELRELVRRGLVIEQDSMFFAPSAVDAASRLLSTALAAEPDGLTVSAIRELLGTSRKYAIPLLAYLDSTGRTRRRGDLRVAGPRLGVAPEG